MSEVSRVESRAEMKERLLSREHLEQVAMEVAVSKRLYSYAQDRKDEIGKLLENGETRRITNGHGAHVSTFSRSNPQPRFVIDDMNAVLPVAMDAGYELVDLLPEEGTPEYWEAVDVLAKHDPGLLRTELPEVEEEELRARVKAEWQVTGKVPVGWRVEEARPGVTSVRVSPVGREIVDRALGDMKGVLALERGTDE